MPPMVEEAVAAAASAAAVDGDEGEARGENPEPDALASVLCRPCRGCMAAAHA